MSCGWTLFYPVLVTLSVALITYNIIISANVPLKQDLPGRSSSSSSLSSDITVDPVIKMRHDRSRRENVEDKKKKRLLFHTAVTASDSVYNTWQCRVMYYWFKRYKDGPGSEMGGFTRILHSGNPDKYMDEIPTFVAQPLPPGTDQGYIVLNRPWAFVQWLQESDIKEDYILMSEPDHIIVKPIPNLARDGHGAAFPFSYIEPKKYESVLRKYYPAERGEITKIDPIGNSPVITGKDALKKIAPTWMNVSLAMKKDPETDKAFGWVLEMYAYAVSSALHGVSNVLHKDVMIHVCQERLCRKLQVHYNHHSLIIYGLNAYARSGKQFRELGFNLLFGVLNQPPWDLEVGDKYIIHYTYGCDYDMKGRLTYGKIGAWRFDKRQYDSSPPPRNLPLPPAGVPESVVRLVKLVNEATANIPNWGA